MEVEAVNSGRGVALTSDGKFIPITDYMDADGEACEPAEAVSVVAGPDENGKWWHVTLSDFTHSPQ